MNNIDNFHRNDPLRFAWLISSITLLIISLPFIGIWILSDKIACWLWSLPKKLKHLIG